METEQFIIAIGASAGGLAQINKFFDFTPLDGVSYIVIQHLSADYKSMMASLLDKHSKLHIKEATNNMIVEPNKVYLIPSANMMTIEDGRLLLFKKQKGINLTIDTFFTSLAKERGNKAIGVILSGTGSDGTEGMKAIKEAGGLLLASNAESAEFYQMPKSIIDTGFVDYVISPEDMPKVIEHYVEKRLGKADTVVNEEEEEKIMRVITKLIKDKLPEDFTGYKKNTILRRIKRRASLNNGSNLEDYLKVLENDNNELQNLAKDFLISVTSFFRDKAAFKVVEQIIIPQIINSKQDEEIKIWVAGCATGEEAYTLAILLSEGLGKANKDNLVKIFATDLDKEALVIAGKGIYDTGITKDVSPERLDKYFTVHAQGYKVNSSIREMLIFAHHDMTKNPPYCNMDLISCRNVLIYMEPILQKRVLMMLHFGLKYKGFLFLGPSENINDIITSIELIDKKSKIYKNIEPRKTVNFDTFMAPNLLEGLASMLPKKQDEQHKNKKAAHNFSVPAEALVRMGFSCVWVNKENHVLSFLGNQKYLLQQMFVHHLPDLLSKSLQVAYSTAVIEADKTDTLIQVKGIPVAGIDLPVTLSVNPLAGEGGEVQRLVLFNEENESNIAHQSIPFDESFYNNKYTVNLEEELKNTKEKLGVTNEMLQASNENMQSYNEELLSANEEMQSTNEEMQSINEELQTINGEYHAKIKQLSELNDDLNNYFRSNLNSQIFVNKDLVLMKFSPPTISLINMLETDIGRPLSDISTNIRFETIDADIKQVLAHGDVITKEIQAINSKWFQVMTMPYLRKGYTEPDGAIITFNDITELKQIQQELADSNKSLQVINEDLDNFVYTASHDLLNPINNIEQLIYFIKEKEQAFDSETKEYVNMLSSSIRKFREVIKEMTAIGNIESERLEIETINLEEMIAEILLSIRLKVASEKAEITTSLEVKNIMFSKKNCRSMLYNLIGNALKFKLPDKPSKIHITTEDLQDYTLLSVKDNGVGIEKNEIERIFKMYKRLNTDKEGQGLGLYLIKKMIDAAGGKIEVDSKPGKGTEFKLYIKKLKVSEVSMSTLPKTATENISRGTR